MACARPIAPPVHRLLVVLDSHADLVGPRVDDAACAGHEVVRLVGMLSGRPDDRSGGHPFPSGPQRDQTSRLDLEPIDPAAPAHLASRGQDARAQLRDDDPEAVRADVGLSVDENVVLRPAAHQQAMPRGHPRAADAREQLPIGVGPRAALAEEKIGFRIEDAAAEEPPDGGDAVGECRALLADERPVSGDGQTVGGV